MPNSQLSSVKNAAKFLFSIFGFRFSRIQPSPHRWLLKRTIRTIVDVGAAKGRSSEEFRHMFPEAEIHAFEPLPDCFAQMQDRMKGDVRFHAHNVAIGDTSGTVVMHRSSYSGSSSLRNMGDMHKTLFPVTAGQRDVSVTVTTLDGILAGKVLQAEVLVKIDVQGYEDKVIAGGAATLRQAAIVIIETSFVPLYNGQPLFGDVHGRMTALGFRYAGTWDPDFRSPEDGVPLQQDSIFVRVT